MRREVTLEEISDGKLYDANDMVKADCQDCKGCFDCCTGGILFFWILMMSVE